MAQKMATVTIGKLSDIDRRGWLVGNFMDSPKWAHEESFEVKWGEHDAGDVKPNGYALNKVAKTLSFLIRGRFKYFWQVDGVEHSQVIEGEGITSFCRRVYHTAGNR